MRKLRISMLLLFCFVGKDEKWKDDESVIVWLLFRHFSSCFHFAHLASGLSMTRNPGQFSGTRWLDMDAHIICHYVIMLAARWSHWANEDMWEPALAIGSLTTAQMLNEQKEQSKKMTFFSFVHASSFQKSKEIQRSKVWGFSFFSSSVLQKLKTWKMKRCFRSFLNYVKKYKN